MAAEVWILIRDDGNTQEAEETIDSVWSSERLCQCRRGEIEGSERAPFLTRFERWTVRSG